MIEDLRILGEVAVALILGGIIGLEREMARKPAGLRTHALVAAAACLFVALGRLLQDYNMDQLAVPAAAVVRTDPVRIIEAIVTGISFLGAGTIIRSPEHERVEGLTTAATVLIAAAVGVTVAIERWVIAIGIVLLVLFIARGVKRLENRLNIHRDRRGHAERQQHM